MIGCELEREGELAEPPGGILLAEDSGMIGCELEREGELAEPPGGIPPLGAEVNLYLSAGRASG